MGGTTKCPESTVERTRGGIGTISKGIGANGIEILGSHQPGHEEWKRTIEQAATKGQSRSERTALEKRLWRRECLLILGRKVRSKAQMGAGRVGHQEERR
jgi:hypothetical protein